MGKGLGWLPDLPFDLDLELHKGGLSPHRKPGGRQGEKMSRRGPNSLREVVAGDRLSRQNEKAQRSAERGRLLGVQAVELKSQQAPEKPSS